MLIKTRYPNLLHGCDFLCFNLMNYQWVWESFVQHSANCAKCSHFFLFVYLEIERSYLLATQLMSMLTISILLIVNHEKPLISSFFFFVVTTCIAATINVQWGMYSLKMVEGLRGVRFSLSDLIFNNQITSLHGWTAICLIMSKVTGRIGQLNPVTKFNYHMTTACTTDFYLDKS